MLQPAVNELPHHFLVAAGKRFSGAAVAGGIVALQTVEKTRQDQHLAYNGSLMPEQAPHDGVELAEVEQTAFFDF